MKAIFFFAVILMLLPSFALGAATPTGSFFISPASPYQAGDTLGFTIDSLGSVPKSYEVTIGVWCDPAIPWGTPDHNINIHEFNSFGRSALDYTFYLTLPATGVQENCTSRLIAAKWFKGTAQQAWTLDEHLFTFTG